MSVSRPNGILRVSQIVAVGQGGVIGAQGTIPWRLATDLRRFRELTWDHTILMGRKTFASLGRLLPRRRHLVLSRDPSFHPDGVIVARSLAEAWEACANEPLVFVIGGGELYRQSLAVTDELHLTEVEAEVPGDTYFDPTPFADWRTLAESSHPAGPRDDFPHRYRWLAR